MIPEVLRSGAIEVRGRLVDASNATLFCSVELDGVTLDCVYKPVRGERPLWDFPDGTLAAREVAAHLVSEAAGAGLIPPTVLRDGPLGPGMVQLWVDVDEGPGLVRVVPPDGVPEGWRVILTAHDRHGGPALLVHADTPAIRRLAVLDLVLNNADRKGGHVLSAQGRVFGIDHGVCLHVEDKLRTVLWGFLGEPLSGRDLDMLATLASALSGPGAAGLAGHLTPKEVRALGDRVDRLRGHGVFPEPTGDRPPIPWPVF